MSSSAEAPARRGVHAAVGSTATRFLVASGISFFGDWLTTVALVVLLFRVTGSPTGPALYILARVAPRVLGPVPGGALADRFSPVGVAVTCAIAQALLTAAIVAFAHAAIVPAIYVAVAGSQFLSSVAQPSYGALIPRIAAADRLGRVNGIYAGLYSSSILVAPALGALLLTRTSPEWLIVGDAASFLVAAALLASLRLERPAFSQASRGSFAAGVPIVLRDPMLRSLAAGWLINSAMVTALQAVLVVAASQHFGRDVDVGWLYAAVGAGGVLGALPVIRRTPSHVRRAEIVTATVFELAPLGLFVFVSNLPLAALLLLISSLSGEIYQTRGWVGLQQRVPAEMLGRTTAVIRFVTYVGMLLGAIAATTMVQPLGWQATVLITGAGCLALLLIATLLGPKSAPVDVDFQAFLDLPE